MDDKRLIFDVNMNWAFAFATGLGKPLELPKELTDIEARANFLAEIDGSFFPDDIGVDGNFLITFAQRISSVSAISAKYMPKISSELSRVNFALRLWSGCLSAAKTIAIETRSGQNTSEIRSRNFSVIDQIARNDSIYLAGVETAPVFKERRRQRVSYEGVPQDSPVRKFAES